MSRRVWSVLQNRFRRSSHPNPGIPVSNTHKHPSGCRHRPRLVRFRKSAIEIDLVSLSSCLEPPLPPCTSFIERGFSFAKNKKGIAPTGCSHPLAGVHISLRLASRRSARASSCLDAKILQSFLGDAAAGQKPVARHHHRRFPDLRHERIKPALAPRPLDEIRREGSPGRCGPARSPRGTQGDGEKHTGQRLRAGGGTRCEGT